MTKGNAGPASYAQIQEGHYATQSSKGTVGGPHVVRITGMDGMAGGESPRDCPPREERSTKTKTVHASGIWPTTFHGFAAVM